MEQPYQEIDEDFTHVNYSETSEAFQNKSYAETSQPSTSVTASEVSPSQNDQPSRDNHFHDGDSTVQNNFTVGGTFRAKRFIHPFGARFHDLNELKSEYPSPVKGMWAWVGIDFPGEIWVCEVDGTWKLLNQSSVTADQLTTILSSYATQAWVNSQGYLTQHQSLASYATQSWVLEQISALNIGSGGGDVDLSEIDRKLDKKLDKSTFDDLFEKVNLGTDAAPKWAIKAKYNFYTVGWLSFRGANDGSGGSAVAGAANLSDLKDVSLGSLAAGQALVWNGAKWVNSTIATSGLDESSLSNYLTSHGYATQSWVNSQNYVTQSWVAAQDYLTKVKSDALYVTAIGTSGNNLTWVKNGTTNNITVPYATRAAFADAVRDPDHHVGATRRTSANINFDNDCALHYFLATSAMTTSKPGTDGHILHMEWDSSLSWAAQLAVPCDTLGSIQYRFQLGASSWHPWRTVVDANNYQSILANTFYNKTEVDNKLSLKLDKATFDDLFEKVNLGTDAAPKWAIKAKYNFYTVGWLSFRGANDGSGGSTSAGAANLADLKDVSLGSLAAGQALVWNGAKWVNSTIATSGLDEASLANYLSSHGYATQAWANGAFVNKAGDTMTGHLTMLAKDVYLKNSTDNSQYVCYGFKNTANAIIAQIGYHNTAKRIVINPVGSSEPWVDAVGKYNLIVGNNELKYNTYTLWHSGNDGHNSGLDADLLDGVHNGEVTARLVNYNNGGNVSGAVQFMQKANGWNAWDAPTQNWYSVIKLNHGNGDTYYSRVLAFDFYSDNIYTHRKHNGTDYSWHTLAFIDSTVANANSLGGKAAAQYVTTDTAQTITGSKTFTNYTKIEQALMFKGGPNGIYFAPSTDGSLRINTHTNYSYTGYIGRISQDGSLAMGSFIKSGGTASQFLKADGSVDGTSYATASALSTGLAGKVSKSGDTMSGDLWFGAPDKGVKFNHAGVNGIWGHTSNNAATNQIGSTALSNLVIASHWGVAFTSTCSNQTYTDKVAVGIDTRIGSVAAGSWVKASHFLANTTRLCTNLNADLLDGLHLDSVRGYRVEHPAINSSLAVGNVPFNAFGMQHGTPMFIDPEFASGTNNVSVYNNLKNGNVKVTRIADNQASANSSGYILQIKVTGAAEPWTGGFVQTIQSRANAVFMQIFRAKIPVGYNVNANSNHMGDKYSDVWITSTAGTGKWEWYARVVYCGASGHFSLGGHVSLKGANATAANPLYWYLSHCQTWDLSKNNYGSLRAKFADALSASRTLWGQSFNGSNNVSGDMTGVGTITSTYYSLHNISNNPYLEFNVGGNITYVQALSTGIGVGPTLKALFVTNDSKVGIGTTSPSEKLSIAGWVGTIGATGWYNITYQGGWHMADSTWIRTYNNKNVHAGSAIIRTDGTIQVGDGGSKFYANSSGVVFAATGIWTNGYMSFRGQNTSSDARQKRIIRDIHVPLTTIAKAPNVVFSWLDNGKLDMGSIAQYWHKHLPLSVCVRDNGYLGMDYSKVALACVISMASELLGVKDDVSVLKQEVRQLRHENRELKQQIDKMGRRIA